MFKPPSLWFSVAPRLKHKVMWDPRVRSTAFYETGEGGVRRRGYIGGYGGSRCLSVSKEDAGRWRRVTCWAGIEIADDMTSAHGLQLAWGVWSPQKIGGIGTW